MIVLAGHEQIDHASVVVQKVARDVKMFRLLVVRGGDAVFIDGEDASMGKCEQDRGMGGDDELRAVQP